MTEAEAPAGINPEPVTAWMDEHVDGVTPPLRFERVAGGHSCLTYVVEDDAGARYVLRRPPIGHVLATAHDVAREHKIISALADSDVPVAPALGLCTEVTIPVGMRWIPRGMTIEYLGKASTDVMATARLDKTEWAHAENVAVPVSVTDANGKEVVRAVISMYISPRKDS